MSVPAEEYANLSDLMSGYQPGFSLDAKFYTSEAIYRRDLEQIFYRHWIYAGHASQLAEPGSYFLMELAGESVLVVRGQDSQIRAFANVCRHRGSRVCLESSGKVRAFVCPYHAWTYELDGRLRSRREMAEDFDQSAYGLKSLPCETFQGLVFVNLDSQAPPLREALEAMDAALQIYELEKTKVACHRTYPVDANWKLAVENFMECYHCAPAHAEYARCHALKSPKDNEALRPAMIEEAQRLGYAVEKLDSCAEDIEVATQCYYVRNALYPQYVTGSQDGKPLAPLLGKVPEYGGGVADIQIGPVSYAIFYPDYAVFYRFVPRGVQKTDMDIVWLVNESAEEGVDYDLENLIWMWDVTTEADKKIILANQKGVNSRFYEPGPLSKMEDFTTGFIQWYLNQIKFG